MSLLGGFVLKVDCRFVSNFSCRLLTEEPKCSCRFDYFPVETSFIKICTVHVSICSTADKIWLDLFLSVYLSGDDRNNGIPLLTAGAVGL